MEPEGQVQSQDHLTCFLPGNNLVLKFLSTKRVIQQWMLDPTKKSPSFKKKKNATGNFHRCRQRHRLRPSPMPSDRLYKNCFIKKCCAMVVTRNVPSAIHKQELIESPTPRCIQTRKTDKWTGNDTRAFLRAFTNDSSDGCWLWHMSAARLMSPSENGTSSISNETAAWLLLPNLCAVWH